MPMTRRFAVLCLATTAHAALLSAPTLSVRSGARPQLRASALSMEEEAPAPAAFVPLPEGIAARVSFQTGGYKQAGQEEEIQILWNTFSACYPTLEQAEVAVNRNSAVILPNLNSPTKITGTYKLLQERFSEEEALEIITKNPGILICTPGSLSDQSNDDIKNAANLVTTLEDNKGLIKGWIGISFLSFPLLVGWQIGRNKGVW